MELAAHLQSFTTLYSKTIVESDFSDLSFKFPRLKRVDGKREQCPYCQISCDWKSFVQHWKPKMSCQVKHFKITPLWSFLVQNPQYFHFCNAKEPDECECVDERDQPVGIRDFRFCIATLLCTHDKPMNAYAFSQLCLGGVPCCHRMCDIMIQLRIFNSVLTVERYKSVHHVLHARMSEDPSGSGVFGLLKQVTTYLPLQIPFDDVDWSMFGLLKSIFEVPFIREIGLLHGIFLIEKIVIRLHSNHSLSTNLGYCLEYPSDIPSTDPRFDTYFQETNSEDDPDWHIVLVGSTYVSKNEKIETIRCTRNEYWLGDSIFAGKDTTYMAMYYFLEVQKLNAMKRMFLLGCLSDNDDDNKANNDNDNVLPGAPVKTSTNK